MPRVSGNPDERGDAPVTAEWPPHERLLICVEARASHERLIREGARLAGRLQADWSVVHVDRARRTHQPADREALLQLGRLTQSLGGELVTIHGDHVAEAVLDYARVRHASRLVLGHRHRRWTLPWRRSVADRIARAAPELSLWLLPPAPEPSPRPEPWPVRRHRTRLTELFFSLLACAVTTAVAALLLRVFDLSNVVMLFLLTVVLVALRWGRVAGALAAFVSVASFDFFFVPPAWSFHVSDTQYIFTFVLMLVVALVTGQLAARLRAEAVTATAGERRATALARVARDLSAAMTPEQIAAICTDDIAPLFGSRGALVLPDAAERLAAPGAAAFVDSDVAQWVYEHVEPAGLGTSTLTATRAQYLPLKAPLRTRGVLALQPQAGVLTSDPDERRLLEACCALIALALERIHFVNVAQDTIVRMEGERMRNALLAAVSHDLKTPLTAIRGLAETLQAPLDPPSPERIEVAQAIHRQAEELHRLVTNLLDLARMQSHGVHLHRQWHALDEIVGSALAGLSTVLAGRRIHVELPADLPLVELDAALFERVLANLLDNAVKYTPAQATVWIRAAALGSTLYVWMDDDGPGLPAGSEALFEPFRRGVKESSITGVGLGLALCRSIVAAHGGSITASQREPHGARFEIRLPLGAAPDVEGESAA